MRFARFLPAGAVLAAACHSATPAPASSPDAVVTYSHVDTTAVFVDARAPLAMFNLEVPLPADSGVCVRRRVPTGVGEEISVHYPDVRHSVAVATVNVDTAGHIFRYTETRGELNLAFDRRLTRQEFDSALTAARRRTRSSSIYLDYPLGQAMLSNDGGGKLNVSTIAPLSAVANEPRFGAPDARAHAIVARCGASPLFQRGVVDSPQTPTGSMPYFEFQVDKQATYAGGTSVSPHPTNGGPTAGALVQFVVDSTGTVRPGTFKVLRMKDQTLVDDARKVMAQWKYTPAEVGGRKVSQLVQVGIER